jgi:exoribonuclease II
MDTLWQGLMLRWLREHEGLALVMLEDLGVEMVMRFDRSVGLGESLWLKVVHVDPRGDRIELREMAESAAQLMG